MVVAIWVRKPVEWEDEGRFLSQVPPDFRRRVELWNETFTIPFHVFRAEVRRIARLNHLAVRGAVCCVWEDIPPGAIVLPVDDDDWFAPDIGDVLAQHWDHAAPVFRWPPSFLEVPTDLRHELFTIRRRLFPGRSCAGAAPPTTTRLSIARARASWPEATCAPAAG